MCRNVYKSIVYALSIFWCTELQLGRCINLRVDCAPRDAPASLKKLPTVAEVDESKINDFIDADATTDDTGLDGESESKGVESEPEYSIDLESTPLESGVSDVESDGGEDNLKTFTAIVGDFVESAPAEFKGEKAESFNFFG